MNPLIRFIPPPLVRFFARPYVAGDSLDKAMSVVDRLWRERSLSATLDLLAEDIREPGQAQRNVETYLEMVDAAADSGLPSEGAPTLSLKPSSFTTRPLHEGGDGSGSYEAIERIAERARERGVGLTVDMEGRHWTDFTLDALRRLRAAGHDHVGGVLQARLRRTEADIAALPEGIRIRIVIGIYQEPEEIALTDKRAIKERMLELAEAVLRAGHYLEFASHDEPCLRRFLDEVVPRVGAERKDFEVQMLYGVPRDRLQRELVAGGVRTRLYVPFALGWDLAIEYLRRRLDEYPAMMWLVAKNMLLRG